MRKIAAMVIMIVMILPVLCVLSVNDTKAENVKAEVGSGGFVPVTLYFHNESNLDTKAPTANNSTTTSLKEGAITFETDSLDKALSVENQSFRVAFNFTVNVTQGNPYVDYVRINLTISVREDGTERASAKYIGEKVYAGAPPSPVSESFSVDTTLCFSEGWDFEFDEDDEIRVRITPEIEEHDVSGPYGGNIALSYTAYMEYDYEDKLGVLSNVYCDPVKIDVSTYDKDNNLKTEFMPNLAAKDCVIKFKSPVKNENAIKNAFGEEDITYVSIEINGVTSPENITENKTKEMLYEWDYSKYSKSFVAGTQYTATITVETVQHTFTQTTNFTFKAYGLEANIDNKASASKTILAGSQTDYTISIRNTGSSKESVTVRMTLSIYVISVSPSGYHAWNITLADKYNETSTTGSFIYEIPNFEGGSLEQLTLTAKSLNITGEVGENWYCKIDIKIEFLEHPVETETLSSTTYLAPPYKIDIKWTKTYDDPYYALVDVESCLYVNVTNMGSMPDTVNLTLNYTNSDVWDITLEPETVSLSSYHYPGYYDSNVKLTVKPSSETGEDTTFVNITAYSKGFALGYNETLTRKYLTLNLSRAFGIKPLNIVPQGSENVDVKNSTGQVTYNVSIETNDNTTHTVDLNAVCNNENIDVSFDDDSVAVSKDSSKIVTMTVTCAKGMLTGSYTITVNASIRGAPVSKHNKTANITVTVKEYYALSVVWADSNKNEITVTAKPGEYIHKTLKVKNEGNSKISVDLTPKATSSKYSLSITFSPFSQFDLSPKEEKNITLILGVPEDAKDGETLVGEIEVTSPGLNKVATILIEIKQSEWEKLIATLYSMIYFIILLIAVVVVFITVWVKKKKMR